MQSKTGLDDLRIQRNYVKDLIDEVDSNRVLGNLYYLIKGYLDEKNAAPTDQSKGCI